MADIDRLHLDVLRKNKLLTTKDVQNANKNISAKLKASKLNTKTMSLKDSLLFGKKYDMGYFAWKELFNQFNIDVHQYVSILNCPKFNKNSSEQNINDFLYGKKMPIEVPLNNYAFNVFDRHTNNVVEDDTDGKDHHHDEPEPPKPPPEEPMPRLDDPTLSPQVRQALQLLYDVQNEYRTRLIEYDKKKAEFNKKFMEWTAEYDEAKLKSTRTEIIPNVELNFYSPYLDAFLDNVVKQKFGDNYHCTGFKKQGIFASKADVFARMNEEYARVLLTGLQGKEPLEPVYPSPPTLKTVLFQDCANKVNITNNGDVHAGDVKQYMSCVASIESTQITSSTTTSTSTTETTTTVTTTPTTTTPTTTTDDKDDKDNPNKNDKTFFEKNINYIIIGGIAVITLALISKKK